MSSSEIKSADNFRVMIVYPNLPLMLVPSIAIGIFTRIFKDLGYLVELFETTHYEAAEINYSETKINYSENRVRILNARKFNIEKDLGIHIKSGMLNDFRRAVEDYQPDFMIYSVVEDTFLQARGMMEMIEDLNIPHLVGGVFPTMAPANSCCGRRPSPFRRPRDWGGTLSIPGHWSDLPTPHGKSFCGSSSLPSGTKSSRPGGNSSGSGTSPRIKLTMQVPQVPEVQFVGRRMPQASACSTMVSPGFTAHWPSR